MSARALRCPPTRGIHHTLCSQSFYTESSLLAARYDLHVVCKSCPQINFCCSSWEAICFVNNLTCKDAETAMANARMESSIKNKQESKGCREQDGKYQYRRIIIRKGKEEVEPEEHNCENTHSSLFLAPLSDTEPSLGDTAHFRFSVSELLSQLKGRMLS